MIIGISGKAGTGKSTLACHLAKHLGCKVVSFAGALRKEVSEQFDLPMAMLTDRYCKENEIVTLGRRRMYIRELMQWWGEERRRANKDYWIDKVLLGLDEDIVIDDVRYINEADAINESWGQLIRLNPYIGWRRPVSGDHASETELDDYEGFDYQFRPDFGGLNDVAHQILRSLDKPFMLG